MGDHKQSQQQQPSWPPRSSNREPALERRSWRRSPLCLARSSRTSSRSTGGPFLSSRLAPPPTRPTWTNWTGGYAASRPRALTNGLCLPRTTWASDQQAENWVHHQGRRGGLGRRAGPHAGQQEPGAERRPLRHPQEQDRERVSAALALALLLP